MSRSDQTLLYTVRLKISFMAQRLCSLLKSNQIKVCPSYFESQNLNLSFTNPFKVNLNASLSGGEDEQKDNKVSLKQ